MNEEVDQLAGVAPEHYANIGMSKSQFLIERALMNCKEFGVVAFWDLSSEDDQFKCSRFFIAPNPMKRTIKDSQGTKLDQILYASPHNKEVFFFFKGYESNWINDLGAGDEDEGLKMHKLHIAFLHLNLDEQKKASIGDTRLITNHCKNLTVIQENGILSSFIEYLDKTKYADQKQLPNPTVIDSPGSTGLANNFKMTIVFTAFMQE